MEGSELETLEKLAANFRSAIVEARAQKVPSALPYFPEGACRLTSRLFALHLTRRRDAARFGSTTLVSGVLPETDLRARHYWLEVDGAVVDLTADAFGERGVVVGAPTAFHHMLMDRVCEDAAGDLASLNAETMARLMRQLVAIEERLPTFAAPPIQ